MHKFTIFIFVIGMTAHAETQVLKVDGMDCEGCVGKVTEKVCLPGKYQSCDVEIIKETGKDPKTKKAAVKKYGQITVATKGNEKVDVSAIREALKGLTYALKEESTQ